MHPAFDMVADGAAGDDMEMGAFFRHDHIVDFLLQTFFPYEQAGLERENGLRSGKSADKISSRKRVGILDRFRVFIFSGSTAFHQ